MGVDGAVAVLEELSLHLQLPLDGHKQLSGPPLEGGRVGRWVDRWAGGWIGG